MKKFLSYLWPDTKRYYSEINGTLEVTYIDGKKVLDTENANYSYGSLQKILEFGVSEINLKTVENTLILGMGGGSVILSLRDKFNYKKNVVAVEIDPKVIQIAAKEFGITESKNQKIIEEDAFKYVENSNDVFQLIIIDVFVDLNVPNKFFEKDFCYNVSKLIDKNGFFIFNIGVNLNEETDKSKEIISHFGKNFEITTYPAVNKTNCLLIGKKL